MVFGRGRVSIYADHIEAAGTALFDNLIEHGQRDFVFLLMTSTMAWESLQDIAN